ncbi:LacI family transcriptional regulator [Marinihelvus fidelis]|uniref:LacI family transcriptional regulator n=1 Tax=Marinihelvus fidelis TaxID=2613842 RepID=A0A5N0TA82_9GAMM|nr:LacI family DNA-binding transcriptional regulator [Marinihelvus fidelis]KAA9131681.1 LacI family transcriptional regulator [Marinihelvus fidelis]
MIKPGGKVTINDIARLAGVSKKTVSRVINDSPKVRPATREKVQAVIEEHGYTPHPEARALALRKSYLVAMIYDNPSPQYIVSMQRGVLDALEASDQQLVIRPCDRNEEGYFESIRRFIKQQRFFGAILPPSVSEDQELVDMLQENNCRYVRIASVIMDTPQNTVKTHDSEGAEKAAHHIADLGHKRIAHIRGPLSFRSSHERFRGFELGLSEYGIRLDSGLVLEGGYTYETGFECASELLAMDNRPTAVFCGNDEMAVGAYQAARQAGIRVPEDFSIVGYDDTPIASRVWPRLTTVRMPIREMGKAAGQLLLSDPAASVHRYVSFTPELVVRESTAPPP